MSKTSLYNWQKWKAGIFSLNESSATGTSDNLLIEVEQKFIDALSTDIRKAESGEFKEMAFNDIFGESTSGKPTTRIIMPYGNIDIETMKFIMIKLLVATRKEYQSNPRLLFSHAIWNPTTQMVKQKYKPLGWLPGDPILEKDKEVASLSLQTVYQSKESDGNSREVDLNFFKLLMKHLPQYAEWWQGNKSKQMAAKQSFFLDNPSLVIQIVAEIENMSTALQEYQASSEPKAGDDIIVVLSRHPIDVLRMSDFKNIQSCHSPGKDYFAACRQEAKRTGGGGVLYTIRKEDFDKKFPDGKLPQTGEIFSDTQRGRKDLLNSPESRLRVRLVTSESAEGEITSYAVPDYKIYGVQATSFRIETLNFFANKQKEKFADPTTKEIKIPDQYSLTRFGGSYEDPADQNVANNFLRLVRTSLLSSGITSSEISKNTEFKHLVDFAYNNSIPWGGDEDEEQELSRDDDDACREAEMIVGSITRDYRNNGYYINISRPDLNCEYGEFEIEDLFAEVTINIPRDLFDPGFDSEDITEGLRKINWSENHSERNAAVLTWPDAELNNENIVALVGNENVEIQISYVASRISSVRRYELLIRDFIQFQDQVDLDDYTEEVKAKLEYLGFLVNTSDNAFKTYNQLLLDLIKEMDRFEYNEEKSTNKSYDFEFKHTITRTGDMNLPLEATARVSDEFKVIFDLKAKQYYADAERQTSLFLGKQSTKISKYTFPKLFIVTTSGHVDRDYLSRKAKVFEFLINVKIDKTLSEEELLTTMNFIRNMNQEPEAIEKAANLAFGKVYSAYLNEVVSTKLLTERTNRKITICVRKKSSLK